MTRNKTVALLVMALGLAASCAGTAPNVLHVQLGPSGPGSTTTEINDGVLGRMLSFQEVTVKQVGGDGTRQVQVTITNTTSRDVAFEYRFVWYDGKGFEVSSLAAWLPAVLGAGESRGFVSTAPGVDAASFRLMVRMPHGVTPAGT